jgi:hypothetical protein
VLEDAGLIVREADAFRENRSTYRITEPLITFYHAIMQPAWSQLERPGSAARVWQAGGQRFEEKVLGPHVEQICRAWALHYADRTGSAAFPRMSVMEFSTTRRTDRLTKSTSSCQESGTAGRHCWRSARPRGVKTWAPSTSSACGTSGACSPRQEVRHDRDKADVLQRRRVHDRPA